MWKYTRRLDLKIIVHFVLILYEFYLASTLNLLTKLIDGLFIR